MAENSDQQLSRQQQQVAPSTNLTLSPKKVDRPSLRHRSPGSPTTRTPDIKTPLDSDKTPSTNRPTLSPLAASILLCVLVTSVLIILAGIVLNALDKLPPYLVNIAGELVAAMGVFATIIGALIERSPFPKGIWKNANRPITIFVSILIVIFLVFADLSIISPSRCLSLGTCPPETATAIAQTTAQASATQAAASGVDARANGVYAQGIPLVYDRLNANSRSEWSENRDPHGNWGCQFQGGMYHVYSKLLDNVVTCVAEGTDLTDYTYQVTMSLLKGDSGGLLFRVNAPKGMYLYYYFLIIPNGGKYQFGLFNGKFQPLQSDFSPAIITDPRQHNVLAVHVNKDTITLYANYKKIYNVKDTSYSHGAVGVFVYEHSNSTEAVFMDARIWTP